MLDRVCHGISHDHLLWLLDRPIASTTTRATYEEDPEAG